MARNATVWVQFEIDGDGKESAADVIGHLLDGGALQTTIEEAGSDLGHRLLIASATVVEAGINPVRAANATPDLLAALVVAEAEIDRLKRGIVATDAAVTIGESMRAQAVALAAIAKARGE